MTTEQDKLKNYVEELCSDSERQYADWEEAQGYNSLVTTLRAGNKRLKEALERQCDNMAFVVNHAELPPWAFNNFRRHLEEDRAVLKEQG